MNLSRKAAFYYFEIFKLTEKVFQRLVIAFVVLISPKLAINLKRFM